MSRKVIIVILCSGLILAFAVKFLAKKTTAIRVEDLTFCKAKVFEPIRRLPVLRHLSKIYDKLYAFPKSRMTLRGKLDVVEAIATRMACDMPPCCNNAVGYLGLKGGDCVVHLRNLPLCGLMRDGDKCGRWNCGPDRITGHQYEITGNLESDFTTTPRLIMEVESFKDLGTLTNKSENTPESPRI